MILQVVPSKEAATSCPDYLAQAQQRGASVASAEVEICSNLGVDAIRGDRQGHFPSSSLLRPLHCRHSLLQTSRQVSKPIFLATHTTSLQQTTQEWGARGWKPQKRRREENKNDKTEMKKKNKISFCKRVRKLLHFPLLAASS